MHARKLSIITPVKDDIVGLKSTLKFLKEISEAIDLEWIIKDGSTDRLFTEKYVEELSLSLNVRYLFSKDISIYQAINQATRLAMGSYVFYLHCGDVVADKNSFISYFNNFIRSGADLASGDVRYFNYDPKIPCRVWMAGRYKKTNLLLGWMPPHTSILVKIKIARKYEYFETFRVSGDYHWLLRVLLDSEVCLYYENRVIVSMRAGGLSNNKPKAFITKLIEDYYAFHYATPNTLKYFTILAVFCKKVRKLKQFRFYVKR